MKSFPSKRASIAAGCDPASGLAGTGSPLPFGSREHELDVGFVAARVRLLNLVRGSWTADVGPLTDLLAALAAWPSGEDGPAVPSLIRVRLQEPVSGAGMVVFPLSWDADHDGGLSLPVLNAQLTLRAGLAGQTFLRLNGSVRPPLPTGAAPASAAAQPRVPSAASVELWLTGVADALASPPALYGRPSPQLTRVASMT
jgi:hypothetical protein